MTINDVTITVRVPKVDASEPQRAYEQLDPEGRAKVDALTEEMSALIEQSLWGDLLTENSYDVIIPSRSSWTTQNQGTTNMLQQSKVEVPTPTGGVEMLFTDVPLHGQLVPLLEVKKALRREKNVNQEDLAARTAKFTPNQKALHQTSVSGYLSGKQPAADAFTAVLEDIFTAEEAKRLASSAPRLPVPSVSGTGPVLGGQSVTGRLPSQPATQTLPPAANPNPNAATASSPIMQRGYGSIPDDAQATDPARAPSTAAPQPSRFPDFPLTLARTLVNKVRQAQKSGEINAGFSLRQQIMWARAYMLLLAEGFQQKEALSGSYHLTVEGRSYGEEKTFLQNLYAQVFGGTPAVPAPNQRKVESEGDRHPREYLLEPFIRAGMPVWVYGVKGAGKTVSAVNVAKRLGRKHLRVQGTENFVEELLLGGMGAVEKNGVMVTEYQYGPLPVMMKAGGVLIVDEPTLIPTEVLMVLQAVLEGEDLVLPQNRGEVIKAEPGFCIVFCDNTLGQGERAEYIGTKPINEATRDRFLFVEYDYMPDAQEDRIVAANLKEFLASLN